MKSLHQQDVMYWLTGMTGSDWLWLAWLVPGVASHASQTLCIASHFCHSSQMWYLPVTSSQTSQRQYIASHFCHGRVHLLGFSVYFPKSLI